MKKLIVVKKDATSTNYEQTTMTDNLSYNVDSEYGAAQKGGKGAPRFNSFVNTNYRKPRGGTYQENMSIDDIKDKIDGLIPLKTMQDKRILTKLPTFRTWVKYINKDTMQFRTGGLLMKVEYPEYIMLANTTQKLAWSVKLDDNIFFIKDPRELIEKAKREIEEKQTIKEQKEKQAKIKDKLYELYERGQLKILKD
jgi:hypothetical protein